MKIVIQDLKGNMLLYGEEPFYFRSNAFFSEDGKIICVTYQYEPDKLIRVEVMEGYNSTEWLYYTAKCNPSWEDLSKRLGTTLVEDISVFRKETIPNQACNVHIGGPVTESHVSLVKSFYNTSNWIWP